LPVFGLSVDENRPRADVTNRVAWSNEGEGGYENLIPRLNAGYLQRHMQRGRAVDRSNTEARSDEVRNVPFESLYESSDGGYPSRIEAFLHIFPLIAANLWNTQRNEISAHRAVPFSQ